ncbi:MAG: hypothetical protein KF799_12805 [Bdellovibrionales bacterium]|nr:hypothetical protein [Bdellovibrionales bacterium]
MSAYILIVAVLIVGACLAGAVARSARLEFPQNLKIQQQFLTGAVLFYAGLIAALLAIGFSGVLRQFDVTPPPFALFVLFILAVAWLFAFSSLGTLIVKHVSLRALVVFHAFRFLAELVLLTAMYEGLAPIQLTLEGYNYDTLTAVTAVALFFYLGRHPNRPLVYAWNVMGLSFLAIIAFIAVTSMPTPLRLFMNEPSNVWVTGNPYILLPGVLVSAALTGHLLIFRKLKYSR